MKWPVAIQEIIDEFNEILSSYMKIERKYGL